MTEPWTFPSVDSYRAKVDPKGFRRGVAHREAVEVARGRALERREANIVTTAAVYQIKICDLEDIAKLR